MKTGFIAGLVASLMVSAAFADDVVEHERMIQKSEEFQKRFESASLLFTRETVGDMRPHEE